MAGGYAVQVTVGAGSTNVAAAFLEFTGAVWTFNVGENNTPVSASTTISDSTSFSVSSGTYLAVSSFVASGDSGTITAGGSPVTFALENTLHASTASIGDEFRNIVVSGAVSINGGFTVANSVHYSCTTTYFNVTSGSTSIVSGQKTTAPWTATSVTLQPAADPGVGDLLYLSVIVDGGSNFPSVVDTAGNSWISEGPFQLQGSPTRVFFVFYCLASLSTPSPTLTACTPSTGTTVGGTAITNLAGTNFAPGATVTFNGASATSVTWVSFTKLTCTTPAGSPGLCNVVVTNPDSLNASNFNIFTYTQPNLGGSPNTALFANDL